jgi:hypothetical protein
MNCNIWAIIIILLIIIIIGLIVFSQKNAKLDLKLDKLEGFDTINTNQTNVPMQNTNIIAMNNDIISNLINQIQNAKPQVNLTNYDPMNSYNDLGESLSSNISIINSSLSNLYNTNIGPGSSTSNQLTQLENTITDLENMTNNLTNELIKKKQFSRIKSLNNGLEMNLVSTPNTYFQDARTGSNVAAYMIGVNGGCLSVGTNDYDVFACNDRNPKQYFKMEQILNETAYQNNIDNTLPFDKIDKSSINYPFVMLRSINNENCLTNNHGTLTVQPCYSYAAQRWMPL